MTTVKQMIEWMKTLPQEAEVECGVETIRGYSTYMTMQPVDIESCTVLDYRSDTNGVSFPAMAGKVVIMIAGE